MSIDVKKLDFIIIFFFFSICKFPLLIKIPSVLVFKFLIKTSELSAKKLKLVSFKLLLLEISTCISLTSPLAIKFLIFKSLLKYISIFVSSLPFLTLFIIKLLKLEGFIFTIIFFKSFMSISSEEICILFIFGFAFNNEKKSK